MGGCRVWHCPRQIDHCYGCVTGAGRGIGAEIAHDLARNGAKVCIADVNSAAADKVTAEIGLRHGSDLTKLREFAT